MIALKVLTYIGLAASVVILMFGIYLVGLFIWAMCISEDNCKGCPNYPDRCRKCKVYKHMDEEDKKTWLKEE